MSLLIWGCGEMAEPVRAEPVPTEPAELHDFLARGVYRSWRSEAELREGLNGTRHRVFLSDAADAEGSSVGAAAVRELWDGEGEEQLAWSAVVKVDAGAGPGAWFFYETYELADRESHLVAAVDASGCASCHAAGLDVIRSEW